MRGLIALLVLLAPAALAAAERVPIILDTDLGGDVDDAFALALALHSPEIELRGVTTVGDDSLTRARMACRMLTAAGRRDVPVARGADPQPKLGIQGSQAQYAGHPAVLFNRMAQPVKESAVELMYRELKASPGAVTICAIGPLTNLARLLKEHPDCKPWIKRIVMMGGAVRVGYSGKPPAEAECNVKSDVAAARAVLASGVPLTIAPLDATLVTLKPDSLKRLFDRGSLLNLQVKAILQLRESADDPILFDPVAVALCCADQFFKFEDMRLEVNDKGFTRAVTGKPNARVATSIRADEFRTWLIERFTANAKPVRALPVTNPAKLVARGGLPNRVHAFEDYETDIERRWWMSGVAEKQAGGRVGRGVLTQDFDDKQGDLSTMYTAVIFNPVPGPPMGKHPRLSFRYKLNGSDRLRVQIYSLSNGYHRCLTLTELPQDEWRDAAVDMRLVRRPDGTGGPLSENERIDDIQFYADANAELWIDDIVLYDAAPEGETRPFPKRLHFTGWFDTGKQGKEWPGEFAIEQKAGHFWHAAKSVRNEQSGFPWLKVHLRGERPLGSNTRLTFRYKLDGADAMTVLLLHNQGNERTSVALKGLKRGEWAQATVDLPPLRTRIADDLRFVLPPGAELRVDDLLLYEP